MRIVFVSNYINHHQIPFCNAMAGQKGVDFTFIQTMPMEQERVSMGWQASGEIPYLKRYYEEEERCRQLILKAEVVLFGGCDDESYVRERLRLKKPLFRYWERLYKEGQWKAISPRGLLQKYQDHTKYRHAPVYLLCAGAYVADDFHLIRAYPGKMYRWGYFPEAKVYDPEALMRGKEKNPQPCILWAGRFIDWKHPELAVECARFLKEQEISFHMLLVGGGDLERVLRDKIEEYGLKAEVEMPGFCPPGRVRELMEQADIFLMTSDRKEGWGAVVNEAMNSGCTVVADHMAGAVPYLIQHGKNGLIYQDGDAGQLFREVKGAVQSPDLRRRLGLEAYRTIVETWNPENAAACLMELLGELGFMPEETAGKTYRTADGPCSPAPVIREKKMYQYLMRDSVDVMS